MYLLLSSLTESWPSVMLFNGSSLFQFPSTRTLRPNWEISLKSKQLPASLILPRRNKKVLLPLTRFYSCISHPTKELPSQSSQISAHMHDCIQSSSHINVVPTDLSLFSPRKCNVMINLLTNFKKTPQLLAQQISEHRKVPRIAEFSFMSKSSF